MITYRAYSRKLDEDGRVQFKDFVQRSNEDTLSVALTPEDALDELDVRGYVPITVGDIRAIQQGRHRLGVARKANEPTCLEITGIDPAKVESIATSLSARAGTPVERLDHRQRIRVGRRH
jgi:hypothetical protein